MEGAPQPRPGYWAQPASARMKNRGNSVKVINIILLCVLALVTLVTLAFFAVSIGANIFLICGALALIPLTICVLTLRWIDRWEPEPLSALFLGFCWGAGMAVLTSLVVGSWVQPLLMNGTTADADMVGAVVQAPLVEELCKGAGVLLLFFLRRRTFDGPIDGVVYAGHGLWNSSAFLGGNFFIVYVALQLPLFIVFIVGIILLRRSEAKLTRMRLSDYVPSGWLAPQEVPMLATGGGRRRALAWSRTFAAAPTMKEFIRIATRLAFTRQRLLVDSRSGAEGRLAAGQELELSLLEKITTVRNELLSHHAAAVWQSQDNLEDSRQTVQARVDGA